MKVLESEQIIFFDVDQTLLKWGKVRKGDKAVHVTCPYSARQETLAVHAGHVKILKDRKARGATIIVWSAGGYQWAKAAVKALKLEPYVTLVMSKPMMYVDDLKAEEILGERLYLGLDSEYGK